MPMHNETFVFPLCHTGESLLLIFRVGTYLYVIYLNIFAFVLGKIYYSFLSVPINIDLDVHNCCYAVNYYLIKERIK